MNYAPLARITQADAEQEPEDDRLQFDRKITIAATVQYRGRTLVVTAEGYSASELCDMLDKRFGPPAQSTNGHAPAATEPPLCPQHAPRKMKPMKHPDRQGHTFMCTFQYESGGYCDERI